MPKHVQNFNKKLHKKPIKKQNIEMGTGALLPEAKGTRA
jgi:hypothetical protein